MSGKDFTGRKSEGVGIGKTGGEGVELWARDPPSGEEGGVNKEQEMSCHKGETLLIAPPLWTTLEKYINDGLHYYAFILESQ